MEWCWRRIPDAFVADTGLLPITRQISWFDDSAIALSCDTLSIFDPYGPARLGVCAVDIVTGEAAVVVDLTRTGVDFVSGLAVDPGGLGAYLIESSDYFAWALHVGDGAVEKTFTLADLGTSDIYWYANSQIPGFDAAGNVVLAIPKGLDIDGDGSDEWVGMHLVRFDWRTETVVSAVAVDSVLGDPRGVFGMLLSRDGAEILYESLDWPGLPPYPPVPGETVELEYPYATNVIPVDDPADNRVVRERTFTAELTDADGNGEYDEYESPGGPDIGLQFPVAWIEGDPAGAVDGAVDLRVSGSRSFSQSGDVTGTLNVNSSLFGPAIGIDASWADGQQVRGSLSCFVICFGTVLTSGPNGSERVSIFFGRGSGNETTATVSGRWFDFDGGFKWYSTRLRVTEG